MIHQFRLHSGGGSEIDSRKACARHWRKFQISVELGFRRRGRGIPNESSCEVSSLDA